jgi:type IV pilus assembly protein PilP
MRSTRFSVCTIFSVAALFTLLSNPICEARSINKPVVVRKKIVMPAAENQKIPMPAPKPDLSGVDPDTEDDTHIDVETAYAGTKAPGYDPAGKIDPFKPLIKNTPNHPSQKTTYADTAGDTPLEKIDLSQLRLTGIVRADSGNRGLVREASGRGYIIVQGTRIGTHGGRVVEVLRDRIIIAEKVNDMFDRIFFQNTEMRFN